MTSSSLAALMMCPRSYAVTWVCDQCPGDVACCLVDRRGQWPWIGRAVLFEVYGGHDGGERDVFAHAAGVLYPVASVGGQRAVDETDESCGGGFDRALPLVGRCGCAGQCCVS